MNDLRKAMRARRRALPEDVQREASQACCRRILDLEEYKSARMVMAYVAVRGELDLTPVIEKILSGGKMLLLPLCEGPGVMSARRVDALSQLVPGAYGIMEPGEDCPAVEPETIDLILTPGTAFDRHGGRVGQGGGYYDRFLPRTRAVRVGVCHDFALTDALDTQPNDARMHLIATPSGLWRVT